MNARAVGRVARLMLAGLLTVAILSCATNPARPVVVLPNGYYLEPDKSDQSDIVRRGGGLVLHSPVAAYAVSANVVAGALGEAPASSRLYSDLAFKGGPNTRYFILDTASGKVESDLNAADWHKRLKDLGVPPDFEIYPPLPWQAQ